MRRALGVALLMIVATAGAGLAQSALVVPGDTVSLRAQPSTDSAVLSTVERGTELAVLEATGSWFKVREPRTGREAYVHALTVKADGGNAAVAPSAPSVAQPPPSAPSGGKDYTRSFSMLLLRAGSFIASDSAFKQVYGSGLVFGGELRFGGKRLDGPRMVVWLEGNTRKRNGKITFTGEATSATVTAFEAGLLYRIKKAKLSPYLGAGLGYYMFKENNALFGEAKKNSVGFCGIGGVTMALRTRIVADVRIKYSTASMTPADVKVNVGGITIGVGLGVKF
jgi:opacity protein-like surface antigen